MRFFLFYPAKNTKWQYVRAVRKVLFVYGALPSEEDSAQGAFAYGALPSEEDLAEYVSSFTP